MASGWFEKKFRISFFHRRRFFPCEVHNFWVCFASVEKFSGEIKSTWKVEHAEKRKDKDKTLNEEFPFTNRLFFFYFSTFFLIVSIVSIVNINGNDFDIEKRLKSSVLQLKQIENWGLDGKFRENVFLRNFSHTKDTQFRERSQVELEKFLRTGERNRTNP